MFDSDETRAGGARARPDQTIGPYRLIEAIGEGGMGEVWLAEQAKPVRRKVALKIIKAGMDTAQVVARFDAERQAVALMDHPAIARVFEAGATAEGRPYFAMEYVRGESITAYCGRHKLTLRERIDLFLQVCDAVQHAHQKGIIHRDLKPSNILVALQDDRPVPKIIDFGVAKATTHSLTDRTLHTELGTFIGTPEYMSPEQAEMSGLDVDTRTDVYSLGAVLYELLTGVMPFDSKALREKTLDDLRRTIRDVDPPRPSTRVTAGDATGDDRGATRIAPAKLAGALKGDLDWITMKALEKDRTRRYGSASDLAADLRRHLNNEPVLAGPPSTLYRVGKFVRRNRAGVAAAAVLLLLLTGFGVTMAVQARRLTIERDRANREQAAAQAVSEFLRIDVLGQASAINQASPDVIPDPDLKVRTALERAAARIEGKFAKQPLVEAKIRRTIGETYAELGLQDQARQQITRALELARRASGEESEETLEMLEAVAWLEGFAGHGAEAVRRYTELAEIYTRRRGPKDADVIRLTHNVAWNQYVDGKPDVAEPAMVKVFALSKEVLGPDDEMTLTARNNLARIYLARGGWREAEPLLSDALAANRRVRGPEHPATVSTMDQLASVLGQQRRLPEAEAIRREVLQIRLRIHGPEHPATLASRSSVAQNLLNQGAPAQLAEAERLFLENLEIAGRLDSEQSRRFANLVRSNLGSLYDEQGRLPEAESMLREASTGLRELHGAKAPATLNAIETLALVMLRQHKYREAEPILRELVAARDTTATQPWRRGFTRNLLGASLAGQRRFAEAEPLIVGGYEDMIKLRASIPALFDGRITGSAQRAVDLYTAWGKPAQAAAWRVKMRDPVNGAGAAPAKE